MSEFSEHILRRQEAIITGTLVDMEHQNSMTWRILTTLLHTVAITAALPFAAFIVSVVAVVLIGTASQTVTMALQTEVTLIPVTRTRPD